YWSFPTGSETANVGFGMPLEAWTATKHQQLGKVLSNLIESDRAIHSRLAKARMCNKIAGWPLTIFNPRLPIIANRVALIGDAAGLINPLSGEGIQYALRSARWCAETLFDRLSSDTLSQLGLSPFAMRVQAEMRYDMALSRFIIDLVSHRLLNRFWLSALAVIAKRAAANSASYDLAAGLFAGIVPARQLFALPFLWSTANSAVMTLGTAGVDILRRASRPTNAIASMFNDVIGHPAATLKWSRDCAMSAFELAMQVAISGDG
ncbi:MAG TPA: hypothetical protein VF772_16115, partial [Terriglobales bacterium]